MSLLGAFLRRDFRLERSYRFAFLTQLGGAFTTLLSAGFLSKLVPSDQAALEPYGGDYFTFVLIGTAALSYFSVALGSFSGQPRPGAEPGHARGAARLTERRAGAAAVRGGVAVPVRDGAARRVPRARVQSCSVPRSTPLTSRWPASSSCSPSIAFSAVGLAGAAVIVLTKRAGLLLTFVAGAFAILGGVLYPIEVLPRVLQFVAEILPMSHGLDGVRRALSPDPDLGAVAVDALVLASFAAVCIPAALEGFRRAVRRARRHGSLSQY